MAKANSNKDTTEDKKAVAKAANTAVAVHDYGDEAGKGLEGTEKHLTIPFLYVLQSNSPEVDDPANGGVPGAKQGMLMNSATKELMDGKEGIVLIPAALQNIFVEWVPRTKGGGFVGMHDVNSEVVQKAKEKAKAEGADFGKFQTEAGNDLVETFYLYAIEEDTGMTVVVAFTSTKINVYKQWITKVNYFQVQTPDGRKVKPPIYAHRVRLTTFKDKNQKGDFYNFVLAPAELEDGKPSMMASLLPPKDHRFDAAKNINEMVTAGTAKAAQETAPPKEEGEAGGKAHF